MRKSVRSNRIQCGLSRASSLMCYFIAFWYWLKYLTNSWISKFIICILKERLLAIPATMSLLPSSPSWELDLPSVSRENYYAVTELCKYAATAKRRDKRGHSPLDECNKSVARSFPSSTNCLLLLWRLFDNDRRETLGSNIWFRFSTSVPGVWFPPLLLLCVLRLR